MAFLSLLLMTAFPLLTPWEAGRALGMGRDKSAEKSSDAAWDIWLSITIIGILLLTALPHALLLRKTVSAPIKRMLAVLGEECPQILDSLHLPEVGYQQLNPARLTSQSAKPGILESAKICMLQGLFSDQLLPIFMPAERLSPSRLEFAMQIAIGDNLLQLEAAVRKMARVLHQVGPTGQVDGHALHLLHVSMSSFCALSVVGLQGF